MLTVQQLDALTDKLESFATVAYDWTRTHQAVVKLTVGGIVLLYSPRLSCSLLLFNCVKGVGLPLLQKSFGELYQSYRKFKTTVKEEAPALEDAVKNLNSVKKEVDDLTVIIKELQAMTTPDEAKIKASMEKAKVGRYPPKKEPKSSLAKLTPPPPLRPILPSSARPARRPWRSGAESTAKWTTAL